MRQWGVLAVLVALLGLATGPWKAASSEGPRAGRRAVRAAGVPAGGRRMAQTSGYTGLPNPAFGPTCQDSTIPLGGFTRRPLDRFIVPGRHVSRPAPLDPHYGSITLPGRYLDGKSCGFTRSVLAT